MAKVSTGKGQASFHNSPNLRKQTNPAQGVSFRSFNRLVMQAIGEPSFAEALAEGLAAKRRAKIQAKRSKSKTTNSET